MPIKMEERTKKFLEAESLTAARNQQGCGDLKAVRIRHTSSAGNGPNWEVAEFVPPLPALAESYAKRAIDRVRGTYALSTE
jgi:hypothetical protein